MTECHYGGCTDHATVFYKIEIKKGDFSDGFTGDLYVARCKVHPMRHIPGSPPIRVSEDEYITSLVIND